MSLQTNKFKKKGFIKIKKFFSKKLINKILEEVSNSENTDIYFDRNGNLRRIERLFDKGKNLKFVNKKILNFLNRFLKKKLVIFKDKFNAKPPGGEGFSPHYDGIFYFKNKNNQNKKGWYEYSDYFVNVLVALDDCNKTNGTIELSQIEDFDFQTLYLNTKKNGTPDINTRHLKKLKFKSINLSIGDILIFSNKVPHKSKKNFSKNNRRTLYYTYCNKISKNPYKKYFFDKMKSKNKTSKSLSGQI